MRKIVVAGFLLSISALKGQVFPFASAVDQLKAWDTQAVTLQPSTTPAVLAFVADPSSAGGDVFDAIFDGAPLPVSLILPDGTEINAATAAALGYQYVTDGSFGLSGLPNPFAVPGNHIVITLPPSQPSGTYTISVDQSSLSAPASLIVSYYSSSSATMGASPSAPLYRVGDTVVLAADAFNGQTPIQNATVNAMIAAPSDVSAQMTIGNYQIISQQAIDAHTSNFTYSVTATNSGPALQTMSAQLVSLSPSITVTTGRVYFGDIAAGGNAVGQNTFTIQYDPSQTLDPTQLRWTSQIPGPVAQVPLLDSGQFDAASGDGVYSGGFVPTRPGDYTAAVKLTATLPSGVSISRTATTTFTVLPAGSVLGSFSDHGVVGGNGLISSVVTTVNVNIQQAGTYLFSMMLQASNGQRLQGTAGGNLGTGPQQLSVQFAGSDLYNLGVDGPYERTNAVLLLEDPAGEKVVDVLSDAGPTASYSLSSFDLGDAYFTGQNTASGVDSTGSGTFDKLEVQSGIFTPADSCTWSAYLSSQGGTRIDTTFGTGTLSAGNNTATFDFDGTKIAQMGVDGPYTVAASVECDATGATANTKFQTGPFTASQFRFVQPTFTLSLPATSGGLFAGGLPSYVMANVNSVGPFSGLVTLSITGLPAGVTGTAFPNAMIGAGQSMFTLGALSSAANGTYNINIVATSGAIAQTAAFALTVTGGTGGSPESVTVAPTSATLSASQTQQFTATVTNASSSTVAWTVNPTGVGTVSGSGLYTAPASIVSTQTVTVMATSADGTASASATVNLVPPSGGSISVSVAPTTATLSTSQTQQFTATVVNASNTAVTWSISPSGIGSIDNTGLYTAPASISATQTVTVTATSVADGTTSASAAVTLSPSGSGGGPVSPARPVGYALDSGNPLASGLAGLYVMNEGSGTTDQNLVDNQAAAFSGSTVPTWNTTNPSVVFGGGRSLSSYLDAGPDLTFDQLTPNQMTVVAKVYVSTLAAAGICEKNDGNAGGSGFAFGWDSTGALRLTVEKSTTNMQAGTVAGAVSAGQWVQMAFTWDGTVGVAASAHLFINGTEQAQGISTDGSGTIGYANATNQSFRIGNASIDAMAGSLNGKIAYLAVYKGRILSPSEMGQLDSQLPLANLSAGSFSLAASPTTQSVTPGTSTTFTISSTATGGFNGAIALSVTGLPAGASASFSPSSITGSGSTTLTVTTTGATPSGAYQLTATGVSGSLTRITVVSLVIGNASFAGPITFGQPMTINYTGSQTTTTLTFNGTVGQKISILTSVNPGVDRSVNVYRPDGTALFNLVDPSFIDATALTQTGTYTLTFTPWGNFTGTATFTIYNVPQDYSSEIVEGGQPVTAYITTPGQNGNWTFSGTAGQLINITTLFGGGGDRNFSVLNPDGSTLYSAIDEPSPVGVLKLSTTGTYKIIWDPWGAFTGYMTLKLWLVPPNTALYLPMYDQPYGGHISAPGQAAQFTFVGLAGWLTTIHLLYNDLGFASVSLLDPGGNTLTSSDWVGKFDLRTVTLPVEGIYTIVVSGDSSNSNFTGNVTVSVSSVPGPVGPISVGISPMSVTLYSSQTQQFSATVNNSTNTAVTWSLYPSGVGSIDGNGLFSAPNSVGSATSVAVTATSVAQPEVSASGIVTLLPGSSNPSPSRPTGSTLDTNNPLSANLAGLFLMNEGNGIADLNLLDNQVANLSGSNAPTWNTSDPSIVFNGGTSLNSYLDAGPDPTFDQLTPQQMTIVAKVYANVVSAAGIVEKNDGDCCGSGFLFGWDNAGALQLNVEKSSGDMTVATTGGAVPPRQWVQLAFTWDGTLGMAGAAHVFVNGTEQGKATSADGSGSIGYTNATSRSFRIGNASFGPVAGSLNGKLAYLAIYKGRILTPTEMSQLDSQLPISISGAGTEGYSIAASPTTAGVTAGSNAIFTITSVSTGGFDSPITFSVTGLPQGATATFSPTSITGGGSTLMTVSTLAAILNGSYQLTVNGASGSTTRTATLTLTVTGGAISVGVAPTTAALSVSQAQQFTATVTNTSNTAVTWSISPTGVGTIDNTGLYTAPSMIATTQTVTVTASSVAHPTATASATVTLSPPPAGTNTATFLATDSVLQGSWIGVYGTDGYNVIGDTVSYPSYVNLTISGQSSWSWTGSTVTASALQKASNPASRIANVWYSGSTFSIDANFKDSAAHTLALYCVDFDVQGRQQQLQVVDASTGNVLDTRNISSFVGGVYVVWQLSGHVKVNITRVAGPNSVVSGVFFGSPVPIPPGSATFMGTDTTTQGNWKGVYGSDGYNVIGDTVAYPAYLTPIVTDESITSWIGSTTDIRGLQKASNPNDRIADIWYSNSTPTFTIDLDFSDGATHRFAMYCVDWDSTSRQQQIDVIDVATNTVLDTRTLTSFHGGVYLVWNVSGRVRVRFTHLAGYNAVVSGLFFGGGQ